jgi:hypothetical protein
MRLRGPSSRAGKGNPVAIRTTFQTACRTAGLKDRTAAKHWPCVCGHVYAAHRCVRFTPGVENVLAAELLDPALLAGLLFGTTTVLQANHQRDIEQLQQHVRTGGDAFVTLDGDFLDARRQRPQQIGIWPFRPEELVAHLRAGYGELPPEAML